MPVEPEHQKLADEVANHAIDTVTPVRVPGELLRQIELWGEWLEAAHDDPI